MDYLASIFVPTGNRRLNELIGFLMCVSALLLFLALASYSPLDPSWNSASVLTGAHAARNWIGIVGAYTADMLLQFLGVGAFLLVIFPAMLGARWFRSLQVQSPLAKSLGGIWLVMFVPAMLALLPGHLRWLHVIPIEGLLGRVIGDVLIHYLNVVGAFHSRRFNCGLRRGSPSSPHSGIATKTGRASVPRNANRKSSNSGESRSQS